MADTTVHATFRNPEFRIFPGKSPTDNLIQRGYMRLLSENLLIGDESFDKESPNYVRNALEHPELGTKLNFQFNPSQLTRSVQARTDTQLWINQSPSQLLQPGIGDMNFGWSMLFNREAEVSGKTVSEDRRSAIGLELSEPPLDAYLDGRRIIKAGAGSYDMFSGGTDEAATMLGVLADIAVLDRITGQSISKESYAYARRRFKLLEDQGLAYEEDELHLEADVTGNEAMSLEEAANLLDKDGDGKSMLLDANRYNSAFLVPNPVRAVFSEHFMVDGYINNVTVTFQKFSPEMVPTVATVDINMHAIYQGFARQKSAFTTFIQLQHLLESPATGTDDGSKPDTAGTSSDYVQDLAALGGVNYGGFSEPLFTGFDHSSDHGDSDGAGFDLTALNIADTGTDTDSPHQLMQIEVDVDQGISFSPFSYLLDSALGREISKQITGLDHTTVGAPGSDKVAGWTQGTFPADLFHAKVWTGLQIRARLKTTGTDAEGKAAMTALLIDSPLGIPASGYGSNGEVFFTDWSPGMRSDLLTIGYDNMPRGTIAKNLIKNRFGDPQASSGQFSGNGPYYTRSIPILCREMGQSDANRYGDQLYIGPRSGIGPRETSVFEAGVGKVDWVPNMLSDGRTLDGEPFVYIHDGGNAIEWGKEEAADGPPITFQIAKGFWEGPGAGSNNSSPFAEKLTLAETVPSSPPDPHVFDIEYQINLLYRVRLFHAANPTDTLSDTEWLVVKPRKSAIGYVKEGKEGDREEPSSSNTHSVSGETTTTTAGIAGGGDARTDDWIRASDLVSGMKGHFKDKHFDGYSKSGTSDVSGGIFKWGRSGLYESGSGDLLGGAFFQSSHPNGGVFKMPENSED